MAETILPEVAPTTVIRFSRDDNDHAAYLLVDGKDIYLGSRPTRDAAQALADDELAKELRAQTAGSAGIDHEPASSKVDRSAAVVAQVAQERAQQRQKADTLRATITAAQDAGRAMTPDQLLDLLDCDAITSAVWARAIDWVYSQIDAGTPPQRLRNDRFTQRLEQRRQYRMKRVRADWQASSKRGARLAATQSQTLAWTLEAEAAERIATARAA